MINGGKKVVTQIVVEYELLEISAPRRLVYFFVLAFVVSTKTRDEGKSDLECPPVPHERNQIIPHLLSMPPQFSPAFFLAINTLHRTTHVFHRTRQRLKHVSRAEIRLCRRPLVRKYIDQRLDRLQHRLCARTSGRKKANEVRRDGVIRIERRGVRVLC